MSEPQAPEKLTKARIAVVVIIVAAALALGIGAAMSDSFDAAIEPFIGLLMAVGFGAYMVTNAMRVVIAFRERQYGWAAFWLLAAVFMASLTVSVLIWYFYR